MTPIPCIGWSSTRAASLTSYRVLLWEANALDAINQTDWEAQRAQILDAMRDAGIKGSRGLLAQLSAQLKELRNKYFETPLSTSAPDALALTRVKAIAQALRDEPALLGYRIEGMGLSLLLELEGEESLDSILRRFLARDESIIWCSEPVIEALSGEAAYDLQNLWQPHVDEVEPVAEVIVGDIDFHHITVLAVEASDALLAAQGKQIVDATLGGGGHSLRLLSQGAEVWGIDQDPIARAAASQRLAEYAHRFHAVAGNFRSIDELMQQQGLTQIDGILADIGISSPQIDCPERGFSFMAEGPLDMRMNPNAPLSAADIVNNESEQEIADIIWQYGEERASRAIARRIVKERAIKPITTTTELANIISSVMPRKGKQHPATRSFQALRIAVNDELGALNELLERGVKMLASGGRMAIITFHSLEDRAVKRYFERVCKPEVDRPEWPEARPNPEYCARLITRKPIIAAEIELKANPRARSAKLRVIEKL